MFVLLVNHATRKSRMPALDPHQPPYRHINHIVSNEPHQKILPPSISKEERAEKINSDLEKMIQFMTVLGQVDRYLSSRAKSFVTTLGRAMENSNNDQDLYNDRDNVMSSFEY